MEPEKPRPEVKKPAPHVTTQLGTGTRVISHRPDNLKSFPAEQGENEARDSQHTQRSRRSRSAQRPPLPKGGFPGGEDIQQGRPTFPPKRVSTEREPFRTVNQAKPMHPPRPPKPPRLYATNLEQNPATNTDLQTKQPEEQTERTQGLQELDRSSPLIDRGLLFEPIEKASTPEQYYKPIVVGRDIFSQPIEKTDPKPSRGDSSQPDSNKNNQVTQAVDPDFQPVERLIVTNELFEPIESPESEKPGNKEETMGVDWMTGLTNQSTGLLTGSQSSEERPGSPHPVVQCEEAVEDILELYETRVGSILVFL